MQGGKLASYTNYSYIWAALAKEPDKYGMTVLPGKGIPIGTFFFAVPETAPNVACAVKFITWMLSDDYQAKQVGETGNPPATISQMNNPTVTSQIPEFQQFVSAAEKLTRWRSPGPEFFEGGSCRRRCLAGKKTPKRRTGCRTPVQDRSLE